MAETFRGYDGHYDNYQNNTHGINTQEPNPVHYDQVLANVERFADLVINR